MCSQRQTDNVDETAHALESRQKGRELRIGATPVDAEGERHVVAFRLVRPPFDLLDAHADGAQLLRQLGEQRRHRVHIGHGASQRRRPRLGNSEGGCFLQPRQRRALDGGRCFELVALLRQRRPSEEAREWFAQLRTRLLHEGPQSFTTKEKMALLLDADSMIWLHRELWSCPASELADWWRLAIRQYNVLTAAPTTALYR